jgi:hypothetical protein
MKKSIMKVRAFLDSKKSALTEQKKSAALTDEQKGKIDEAMQMVQDAINALDAAEEEATNEQIVAAFTAAMEALTMSNDAAAQAMQKEVEAKLSKIQAKLEKGIAPVKKFVAKMSLKSLKASPEKSIDGFKPFSAGVDVTAWTPEAEIENVEIFHPLIGVAAGFDVSTTGKTSIKVRTMEKGSGAAAVVLNHGVKPVIEYTGAQSVVNVGTYAGVVEGIADEDLEDNAELENEIQMEAMYELAVAENVAALALLDGTAKAYANTNFGTASYADNKTALAAIIDQVRQAMGTRQSEICVAMNSSEWAKLKDLRNENGTPIDIQSVIGDVIQIADNSIASDTVYCWAKKFAKIKIYKAGQADWYKGVKVTTDDGAVTAVYSEWRTDESSLRVRQREAIYITDDTTAVKTTLTGVIAALTPQP